MIKRVSRGIALTVLSALLMFNTAYADSMVAYGASYETTAGSATDSEEQIEKDREDTEESKEDDSAFGMSKDMTEEAAEAGSEEATEEASEEISEEISEEADKSDEETAEEATTEGAAESSFSGEEASEETSEEAVIEEEIRDTGLVGDRLPTSELGYGITYDYDETKGEVTIHYHGNTGTIYDFDMSGSDVSPLRQYEGVKTITVEEGIRQIGRYSLSVNATPGISSVKVNLPSTVSCILDGAFYVNGGDSKVDITLPGRATNLIGKVFNGNYNNIVFEDGITVIRDAWFDGCVVYGDLKLPETLETINSHGLKNLYCRNPLVLPKSLKLIEGYSFMDYRGEVLYFTGDLPKIEENAFYKDIEKVSDIHKTSYFLIGYYPADNPTWTDEAVEALRKLNPQIDFRKNVEAAISGKCGKDIEWSYSESDRTLTLTGSGPMDDYSASQLPPWTELRHEIRDVVIDGEITSIGDFAFYNLYSSDSADQRKATLTIPADNKLESIGQYAFFCTNLINANLFNNVTSIGDCAFYHNLSYVCSDNCYINSEATCIGDHAFEGCLEKLVIPEFTRLARIGDRAFSECESATGSLKFGDNITYIGKGAFYGCKNIESEIRLSENLEYLGEQAFDGAVKAYGDIVIPEAVPFLRDRVFSNTAITSVTMSDSTTGISTALSDCKSLTKVELGSRIQSLGLGCFKNCAALTEIVIPESATYICFDGFMGTNVSKYVFKGNFPNSYTSAGCSIPMNPKIYYTRSNRTWRSYTDEEKAERLEITRFNPEFIGDGPEGKAIVTFVRADDNYVIVDQQIIDLGATATRTARFDIEDFNDIGEYYYLDGEKEGQRFDFADPITDDVTISVKYEKKLYVVVGFYDYEYNEINYVRLERGQKVEEPESAPEREGYDFISWCYIEDDDVFVPYDFDQPVMYNLDLFPTYRGTDIVNISRSYKYTGKPITCTDMTVYDGDNLLTAGKDYTVSYKNNVKVGTATVTVTFKGLYTGTFVKTFEIVPVDLSEEQEEERLIISPDLLYLRYNGKKQKGKADIKIIRDGKVVTLKEGTDYRFIYPESDETGEITGSYVLKYPGCYTVRVEGMGGYKGEVSFTECITTLVPLKDVKFYGIRNRSYQDGEEVTQDYIYGIYAGRYLLLEDEEFSVYYENNTDVGTAYVTLTGNEEYGCVGSRTFKFKITGTPISKKVMKGFKSSLPYADGEKVEQFINIYTSSRAAKEGDEYGLLEEDTDYSIRYENNEKAGKATMIITGMGGFTGTIKKTFKITPKNVNDDIHCVTREDEESDDSILSSELSRIVVIGEKSCEYTKGGAKPQPVVYARNSDSSYRKLTPGTDYSLTYGKNNKVGEDTGSFKITLKGNYRGSVTCTFDIEMADFSKCSIIADDIKHKNAVGICKPKVTVSDASGKKLAKGKDYTQTVCYKNDTVLLKYDKAQKKYVEDRVAVAGTEVNLKKDIIPADTEMVVRVSPMGSYEFRNTEETSFIERSFRIYSTGYDISKANIVIKDKIYFGSEVKLSYDTDFETAILNGTELIPGTDFVCQQYSNNKKFGKGKVVLRGIGQYAGTRTVTFRIVPRTPTKN